jgi:hypothetical protein
VAGGPDLRVGPGRAEPAGRVDQRQRGGRGLSSDFNSSVAAPGPRFTRDIAGSGVGPGIRIQDAKTTGNLIQSNFIGTDVTGTLAISNHNGVEVFNGAYSNYFGNPNVEGTGNLVRFNVHDGVRVAPTPNNADDGKGNPVPWATRT